MIGTWNSEAFSSVLSPIVKKPSYLDQLKFLASIGTSSETEVTEHVVGTRKQKLNEDFTAIQGNGSNLQLVVIVQRHVVYCSFCKTMDGTPFLRDLISIVTKLTWIIIES